LVEGIQVSGTDGDEEATLRESGAGHYHRNHFPGFAIIIPKYNFLRTKVIDFLQVSKTFQYTESYLFYASSCFCNALKSTCAMTDRVAHDNVRAWTHHWIISLVECGIYHEY
jgi:hypothetical protein